MAATCSYVSGKVHVRVCPEYHVNLMQKNKSCFRKLCSVFLNEAIETDWHIVGLLHGIC